MNNAILPTCMQCGNELTNGTICGNCSFDNRTFFEGEFNTNPIYEQDGLWYFWDETWTDSYGPFDTEEQAKEAIRTYIITFL